MGAGNGNSSNAVLIRALAIFGSAVVISLTALAIWGPVQSDRADQIVGTIATVTAVIVPTLVSLKVIVATHAEASRSADLSQANAEKLSVMSDQASNTAEIAGETHDLVSTQRAAIQKQIRDLELTLRDLKGPPKRS